MLDTEKDFCIVKVKKGEIVNAGKGILAPTNLSFIKRRNYASGESNASYGKQV